MSVTHIPQVAIETRHLYKRFGDVTALDDINLRIAQGEFVAIMGASGSGKTTLMNILTCLDTATEGQVFLDGTDAAALDEEGRRRFRENRPGISAVPFDPVLNCAGKHHARPALPQRGG